MAQDGHDDLHEEALAALQNCVSILHSLPGPSRHDGRIRKHVKKLRALCSAPASSASQKLPKLMSTSWTNVYEEVCDSHDMSEEQRKFLLKASKSVAMASWNVEEIVTATDTRIEGGNTLVQSLLRSCMVHTQTSKTVERILSVLLCHGVSQTISAEQHINTEGALVEAAKELNTSVGYAKQTVATGRFLLNMLDVVDLGALHMLGATNLIFGRYIPTLVNAFVDCCQAMDDFGQRARCLSPTVFVTIVKTIRNFPDLAVVEGTHLFSILNNFASTNPAVALQAGWQVHRSSTAKVFPDAGSVPATLLQAPRLGDLEQRLGSLKQALPSAIGKRTPHMEIVLQMSIVLRLKGEYKQSQLVIEELRTHPYCHVDSASDATLLARLYLSALENLVQTDRLEEAMELLSTETAWVPQNAWREPVNLDLQLKKTLLLAKLFRAQGEFRECQNVLQGILKRDGPWNDLPTRCWLADAQIDLDEPEQAFATLQCILSRPSFDHRDLRKKTNVRRLYTSLAEANIANGNLIVALELLRKLEEVYTQLSQLSINNQVLHVHSLIALARCLHETDGDAAKKYWENVQRTAEKYPSFDDRVGSSGYTYRTKLNFEAYFSSKYKNSGYVEFILAT